MHVDVDAVVANINVVNQQPTQVLCVQPAAAAQSHDGADAPAGLRSGLAQRDAPDGRLLHQGVPLAHRVVAEARHLDADVGRHP